MKDKIEIGDIVCYGSQNHCRMGKVSQILNYHTQYIITPLKGVRPVKRNYKEIVSAERLSLAQQNSKYAR